MNINYKEVELTHLHLQKGMYFSEVIQKDKYVIAYSKIIQDNYWNYATLISADNIESFSNEIETFFLAHARTPAYYLTSYNHYFNQQENFLINAGYRKEFMDSWMLFDLDQKKAINQYIERCDLKFIEVKNLDDMKVFVEVFKNAYSSGSSEDIYGALPEYYYEALFSSFHNKENGKKVIHLIGYSNDEPVSIATCIAFKQFAGIYNVGTAHKHRKKGFGSITSAAAISNAMAQDSKLIFLQTENGSYVEQFYSKLAFSKQFTGTCFVKGLREETS